MEVLPGPLPDGRRSGGDEGLGSRLPNWEWSTGRHYGYNTSKLGVVVTMVTIPPNWEWSSLWLQYLQTGSGRHYGYTIPPNWEWSSLWLQYFFFILSLLDTQMTRTLGTNRFTAKLS